MKSSVVNVSGGATEGGYVLRIRRDQGVGVMGASRHVCVLCGAGKESKVLVGRNGAICTACLGDAFRAVAMVPPANSWASRMTADRRCLLCDAGVAEVSAMVFRSPYCLCGQCLQEQFARALQRDDAPFVVIGF